MKGGVRGPRNPYKNVKPMPTKGPQGQEIFENAKNTSTETTK